MKLFTKSPKTAALTYSIGCENIECAYLWSGEVARFATREEAHAYLMSDKCCDSCELCASR